MPEEILSALARNLSVVDGMYGAVMITAETTGAALVMLPVGNSVKLDVAHGALLGATSAVYAYIAIDSELLVCYHEAVEVSTDDMAERPGCQA